MTPLPSPLLRFQAHLAADGMGLVYKEYRDYLKQNGMSSKAIDYYSKVRFGYLDFEPTFKVKLKDRDKDIHLALKEEAWVPSPENLPGELKRKILPEHVPKPRGLKIEMPPPIIQPEKKDEPTKPLEPTKAESPDRSADSTAGVRDVETDTTPLDSYSLNDAILMAKSDCLPSELSWVCARIIIDRDTSQWRRTNFKNKLGEPPTPEALFLLAECQQDDKARQDLFRQVVGKLMKSADTGQEVDEVARAEEKSVKDLRKILKEL